MFVAPPSGLPDPDRVAQTCRALPDQRLQLTDLHFCVVVASPQLPITGCDLWLVVTVVALCEIADIYY